MVVATGEVEVVVVSPKGEAPALNHTVQALGMTPSHLREKRKALKKQPEQAS